MANPVNSEMLANNENGVSHFKFLIVIIANIGTRKLAKRMRYSMHVSFALSTYKIYGDDIFHYKKRTGKTYYCYLCSNVTLPEIYLVQ